MRFLTWGLDRESITFIYDADLDIVKITCISKMEFLAQGFQTLEHEQDRQMHRQTRPNALPHGRIPGW